MDPDLLGYLLNALAPEEQRQVEAYLASDPEARQRLRLLRQALAPLETDRDAIEPPPGLAARTLAPLPGPARLTNSPSAPGLCPAYVNNQ